MCRKTVLNWEKCLFWSNTELSLDIISHKGIEVDKTKVDIIKNLPNPKTIRDIRSFLGHACFYRRFIKDFAKIARPLCTLLGKDIPFIFNDKCIEAFNLLK